jgi:hypothetical protein
MAFILEHPTVIESYLAEQDRRYEEIKLRYPLPAEMVERYEWARENALLKPA